jgi:hypothetical protein
METLPLPSAGRPLFGQLVRALPTEWTTVTIMGEKQEQPGNEITPDEGHNAHPVEPAEGAREPGEGATGPGEDANELRPPHPDQPAEGER